MSDAPKVPIEDQLACVERELGYRRRVYARFVENRKMTQAKVDLELRNMGAVRDTIAELAQKGRLPL